MSDLKKVAQPKIKKTTKVAPKMKTKVAPKQSLKKQNFFKSISPEKKIEILEEPHAVEPVPPAPIVEAQPVVEPVAEPQVVKPSKPTYSMEVKTMQMNVIKILIESLKEVINDATFIFDKDGIHMKAIDGPESIYVNMNLRASGFESFYLRGRRTTIAIGIVRLFKLIGRSITSNDVISLYLDDGNREHLGVEMANFGRKSTDEFKIKLIELNNVDIQFEHDYQYNTVFSLPASYFHKLCRDMNYVSKTVSITCVGEQVMFSCKSAIGTRDSPIEPTKEYLKFIKNTAPDDIKQNSFCLSDLISFTKFTNLSTNSRVKVHLLNDAPLLLEYTVGDLGTISIYIGAVKPEDVKDN
jgi:proliferating cell nuclear antigen